VADLNLPADLVEFLRAGKQLEYDPGTCEAGAVTLLSLDQLCLELFPMDCQSTRVARRDPHRGERGCYLVEGVNLVASCTGGYHGAGLLLWLPRDERYATWDDSHDYIGVFRSWARWKHIVEAPAQHINAQWTGAFADSAPASCFVPWTRHVYNVQQVHRQLPDWTAWYNATWTRLGDVQKGDRVRCAEEIHLRIEIPDPDHRTFTAEARRMDAAHQWQPIVTTSKALTVRQWKQIQAWLEAGFWGQVDADDPPRSGETETMWSWQGFRGRVYRTLYRTYPGGANDALQELGARLADFAELPGW
jgi:hypothetical protein